MNIPQAYFDTFVYLKENVSTYLCCVEVVHIPSSVHALTVLRKRYSAHVHNVTDSITTEIVITFKLLYKGYKHSQLFLLRSKTENSTP